MKSSHMRSPRLRPHGESWSQYRSRYRSISRCRNRTTVTRWPARYCPEVRAFPSFIRGGSDRLGPIRGIDPHIFRSEVAGPIAGFGFANMQIHDQRNVLGEKLVAGG